MAGDLSLSIKIGAVVGGALAGLGSIGKTLDQLTSHSDRLKAKQGELGAMIERHMGTLAPKTLAALNRDYEKLGRTIDQLRQKQERLAAGMARQEQLKMQRADLRGEALDTLAIGATVAMPVRQAVAFEDAMLGVAKQVQGARDETGKLTPLYYEMGRSIQAIGRDTPLATNEIAKLVEGGARMGVQGKENLLIFARQTAMMASAFEMPTEQIGESMGKIATLYKIPIPAIGELADTINYLDDNTITKGADLINVMERTAGVFANVKISTKDAAALGSTLLTLGETRETAATAINAIVQKFAAAEKGTKKFQAALGEVGLSASDVQKGMATDAMGTLGKISDAIRKLPQDKRIGVMVELAGMEHSDTLAKLVSNPEELAKQRKLASSTDAQGSMLREFEARKQTTSAQWAMMKNRLTELTVNLGSILLPTLNSIMGTIGPLVSKMADWAQAHPAVTHALIGTVVALASFKVASLGVRYGANLILSEYGKLKDGLGHLSAQWLKFKAMNQAGDFDKIKSRLSRFVPPMPQGGWRAIGPGLASGFQAALPWLGRAAMMLLRLSPIGLALSAVGLLVYKYWQPIKGFFVGLWQGLSSVAGPALKALWDGAKSLGLAFGRLIMTVTPLGVIFRLLKPAVMPVLGAIADGALAVWRWFTTLLKPVDDAGGKAQNMGLRFGQAIGGIIKAVVGLPARFMQLGADIVNGLVKGIQDKIGSAVQAIGEVGNKVATKFRSVLGIKSPSRLFMGFGQNIGEGAAIGIGKSTGLAGKAAGALATATVVGFGAPALATPKMPVPHPPAIPAMAAPEVAMPRLPQLPPLVAPAVPAPQVPALPALKLAAPEMVAPRLPDIPALTVPAMVPPAVPALTALTSPVSVAQRQPGTPVLAMPAMPAAEMPSTALPAAGKSGGAPVTVTFAPVIHMATGGGNAPVREQVQAGLAESYRVFETNMRRYLGNKGRGEF